MDTAISKAKENTENSVTIDGGKFLSFFLGEEEYAIEILKVQEIISVTDITPIPRMPEYMVGIINLRSKVVPVIDLRKRFRLKPIDLTADSVMIVVREAEKLRAILVDRVSEVADIKKEEIEQIETSCSSIDIRFLHGLGNVSGSIKLILNIENIVSELSGIEY